MLSTFHNSDQSILTYQPLLGLNFIFHPSILSNSYVLSINSTFSLYLLAWFCHLQLNNLWIRQKLRLKRDHCQNLGGDFSNVQSWFKKQTFSSFLLRSDRDMQIMTKHSALWTHGREQRRKKSVKKLYMPPSYPTIFPWLGHASIYQTQERYPTYWSILIFRDKQICANLFVLFPYPSRIF